MQGTVAGSVIVKRILPAALELAGLAFTILDVLAEVDGFFWCDIETNRLSQVFKRNLAITIMIEPMEQFLDLSFCGHEAPRGNQLAKTVIFDSVMRGQPPLIKNAFNRIMCAESTLDQPFFEGRFCNNGGGNLLVWFYFLHCAL